MRIAMVCYASSGGSGVLATELGLALARKGHQVHLIASEMPLRLIGSWKKNVFYHEVESFDYPLFKYPPHDLAIANKIYDVVIQNKIDVIHCHYAVPFAAAGYLAKQMLEKNGKKVCLITTVHGTDVSIVGTNPILKDVVAFSLQQCDMVTSVSRAMAEEAESVYGLKKPLEVIYNFVDEKTVMVKPSDDLKEIFGFNNAKIITHVSNFRAVKRVEDVVKIFAKVEKKTNVRLLLIGDGPEQRSAYKMASKLGLINKIHFLGLQSSIGKLMSITDIFLLPSEKENFSLSALEAMACGVPVISTSVGGMSEMIDHGENGYLAEIADIDSMAKYAVKLFEDKELYKKISENAKKKVTDNFTAVKIVPQYERLYKDLIHKIIGK